MPANYRDWLNLFYESIHHPDDYHVNLANRGIKKAVELIDYDGLSPEARHLMKIAEQRKVVRKMDDDKAKKEGWEEGLEAGSIKMAKIMKAEGEPITKIMKYTGLSKEKIEKL